MQKNPGLISYAHPLYRISYVIKYMSHRWLAKNFCYTRLIYTLPYCSIFSTSRLSHIQGILFEFITRRKKHTCMCDILLSRIMVILFLLNNLLLYIFHRVILIVIWYKKPNK